VVTANGRGIFKNLIKKRVTKIATTNGSGRM
jgi:hypothetical protein